MSFSSKPLSIRSREFKHAEKPSCEHNRCLTVKYKTITQKGGWETETIGSWKNFIIKFSVGEICVANFIPSANVEILGNNLMSKIWFQQKLNVFKASTQNRCYKNSSGSQ